MKLFKELGSCFHLHKIELKMVFHIEIVAQKLAPSFSLFSNSPLKSDKLVFFVFFLPEAFLNLSQMTPCLDKSKHVKREHDEFF